MIVVQLPPSLNANYGDEYFIKSCYFSDMFISDDFEGDDFLSKILNAMVKIFKENQYPSLYNFSVEIINEIEHLIKFHFQVPKYSVVQDSMEYDEKPVSFWGIAGYNETDLDVSNLI